MNILTFTNCPLDSRLGSGKTVLHYSQGLRDLGHRVEVYEPKDFRLWPRMQRANKSRTALGSWSLVNRKVRRGRFDILELYGDEFGFSTAYWARRHHPLLVAHTNGLELLASERARAFTAPPSGAGRWYSGLVSRSHSIFSRLALAHADAFVALCDLDRRKVLDLGLLPKEHTAVVPPGLDREYLEAAYDTVRSQDRIAFTGSWIARKGIATVARVMTTVLSRNPTWRFDVYGAGVAADVVLGDFPRQLQERIVVHPRLHEREIAQGLTQAKVFFFPSQYEGFGIALAEAMACGCACVTTPTGFGAELKQDQEAVICDFQDEGAMAEHTQRLMADDARRLRVAAQGRLRTRQLTWETNVRRLETHYRDWVTEHRGRPRHARGGGSFG